MRQHRNFYIWSAVVAAVALVFATFAPAAAASSVATNSLEQAQQQTQQAPRIGMNAQTAGAPVAGTIQLAPDAEHWYRFRSGDTDDDTIPTTVQLDMNTPGCINFWIQTEERLQGGPDEDDDGIPEPLGVGSPTFAPGEENDQDTSQLLWRGGADARTTFYVIVRNDSNATCAYNLSIEGPTVFFPEPETQPAPQQMTQEQMTDGQMTQQQMQETSMQQMPEAEPQGIGTSPANAGAPLNTAVQIGNGVNHWYEFVSGSEDAGIPVTVRLDMSTSGCVNFWVQDPERLQQGPDIDDDNIPEPLGVGSPAYLPDGNDGEGELDRSLLIWEGVPSTTGTFYIIVRHQNGPSCTYDLTIEGPDVTF